MRTRSAFLGGLSRLTLAATLLACQAQLGQAAADLQDRQVHGIVQDDVGHQPAFLQVLCWIKGAERTFQQWGTSNDKGEFVLLAPPDAQHFSCWISSSDVCAAPAAPSTAVLRP